MTRAKLAAAPRPAPLDVPWTPPPPAAPRPRREGQYSLTAEDGDDVERESLDQYRTMDQQVGYVVHEWAAAQGKPGVPTYPPGARAAPPPQPLPPTPPELIPVYHDGGKGGCGKVGLLFARKLGDGDTIGPADVFRIDGQRHTSGPLVCGVCAGAMTPANWSYAE